MDTIRDRHRTIELKPCYVKIVERYDGDWSAAEGAAPVKE